MATFTSWKSGVSPLQMREIDRTAEEDYGISSIMLMEVAGLATARVARSMIESPLTGRWVCVLIGPGNNGADGLVAARRLKGWKAEVSALTSYATGEARGLSQTQMFAAERSGVSVAPWLGALPRCDLVIDALLGFGSQGPAGGNVEAMIEAMNRERGPVLALDVPSGIDAETGVAPGACVAATATVTLALAKTGLLTPAARRFVGRLFLADIGVPGPLLMGLGIDIGGLFEGDDIVELDPATGAEADP